MNTADFRVTQEQTFNFKTGKLYLMLVRNNGKFGVEVVDKTKTFGRKITKDNEQASLLFGLMAEKIVKCEQLKDAEDFIINYFSFKSIDKILFVLKVEGKVSSQSDIVSMKKTLKFFTSIKTGFIKDIRDKDSLTVYIYESSRHLKPYGVFVGNMRGKNMKFELL